MYIACVKKEKTSGWTFFPCMTHHREKTQPKRSRQKKCASSAKITLALLCLVEYVWKYLPMLEHCMSILPLWFWLKPCLHYWNDPNLWILYNVWYKFMFCPPESSQVPEQQWLELLMPSLQLNLFSSAMNDGWTWKLIALNAVLRSSCVCPAVCRGVVIEHVVNLFDFVIEHVCCIFP